MTFEETMNDIRKYLDNWKITDILGQHTSKISNIVLEIENQFKHLSTNDTVYDFDKNKMVEDVKEIFFTLKLIYMDEPISKEFSNFIISFCRLVFNWNVNVVKDSFIEAESLFIERIYKGYLTTEELFIFAKGMLERARLMKDFATPSVELSKHYLESLDKKK